MCGNIKARRRTDLSESERSTVSLLEERRRVFLTPELVSVEFGCIRDVVLELDDSRKRRGCGIVCGRIEGRTESEIGREVSSTRRRRWKRRKVKEKNSRRHLVRRSFYDRSRRTLLHPLVLPVSSQIFDSRLDSLLRPDRVESRRRLTWVSRAYEESNVLDGSSVEGVELP